MFRFVPWNRRVETRDGLRATFGPGRCQGHNWHFQSHHGISTMLHQEFHGVFFSNENKLRKANKKLAKEEETVFFGFLGLVFCFCLASSWGFCCFPPPLGGLHRQRGGWQYQEETTTPRGQRLEDRLVDLLGLTTLGCFLGVGGFDFWVWFLVYIILFFFWGGG